MDFDLGNRNSKLRKEQEKRKLDAKKKAEKERRVKEEVRKKQLEMEKTIELKRKQDLERQQEQLRLEEEERRKTGGIKFQIELKAERIDGEGDKITLPVSYLEILTSQEITDQGPMLFKISLSSNPSIFTHCGMLEFTADEGTVGLPPKVRRSLGIDEEIENENENKLEEKVIIKYLRLEKGTFAKVQPKKGGMTMISEIRAMLEHNMRKHATLTVGDILTVWHRGKAFDLTVIELKPENFVTVIDTDLEIDLDIPEDQMQREKKETDELNARGHRLSGGNNYSSLVPMFNEQLNNNNGVEESKQSYIDNANMDIDDNDNNYRNSGGYTLSSSPSLPSPPQPMMESSSQPMIELPPEPIGEDSNNVISCMVRKPDGNRCTRQFKKTDKMKYLFHFVENSSREQQFHPANSFRLVTRFPRKVFTMEESQDLTFIDSGLSNDQEAFMLEVI